MNPTPGPAKDRRWRLQLSVILVQLREEAIPIEPLPGTDARRSADARGGSATTDSTERSGSVTRRRRRFGRGPRTRSNITVGEILDRTRQAGFGFIVALLALIAVPFVGLSTPFGLAITFVGIQMMFGLDRPWLPAKLRGHQVSMATLQWLGRRLARWTAGLEHFIRPRFTFMVTGPFWIACGAGIVIQGLALALPLPIPGSNWIFIIPIIVYGIGLLESDGLLIMVCHLITLVEVGLGVWLSELIVRGLTDAYSWFTGLFG